MTTLSWDLVAGDPAPGEPTAYRDLAHDLAETATDAADAHRRLTAFCTSCDETIWRGEAADAFRDKIKDLPPKLEKLHRSYDTASQAMAAYGAVLSNLQPRARSYLEEAQAAHQEKGVQEQRLRQAEAAAGANPPGSVPAPSPEVFDRAIDAADDRLRDARRQIERIRDEREAAEARAVSGLHRAHDLGIRNDSWLKRRLHDIDRWIDKHANVLRTISSALKIVSAVAGLLSFIPVLAPVCGPIALATAGAALLIDGARCATGNGSWKAFAVDAALMALPGVGKFASRVIRGGTRATELADGTVELSLRYKRGWTVAQKAAADGKVAALNDADLVVTRVRRAGTSARARYTRAGGQVPHKYDVDHVVDLQLGGADRVSNMRPLDRSVNRSLGSQIHHQIKPLDEGTRVGKVSIQERELGGVPVGVSKPDGS